MCTQQNADIDCCGLCSAVDNSNNVGVTTIVNVSTFHLVPRLRIGWTVTSIPLIYRNQLTNLCYTKSKQDATQLKTRRSQWPRGLGVGLGLLACWDCGFESRRHGRMSVVSVVCCQVEVFALGWSLVQRSYTEFGVSECDQVQQKHWVWSGATETLLVIRCNRNTECDQVQQKHSALTVSR